MKQKSTQALYAYWNAVRRDRLAPRRFEIEPARIPDLLPETFILEKAAAEQYRFRLAGTRICDVFGTELRGSDILDGWSVEDHDRIVAALRDVTDRGAVAVIAFEATFERDHTNELEVIILPLLHTGETIDRLLGAISPLSTHDWMGHEALKSRRLIACNTIWPEGRPHSMVERRPHQAPFLQHIRTSRIVRSNRRQFRVYDGGRDA